MTTNQTIDGVPRELLERAVQAIINTSQMHPALEELRALLDAPACKVCGDSGWVPEPFSVRENVLECPECKSAAQAQVEPVELPAMLDTVQMDGYQSPFDAGWNAYGEKVLAMGPLYAEQLSPAAVVLPERKHVPDFTQHPLLNKEYTGFNNCLDDMKRLNPSL